jgi:hypothetical protein
VACWGIADVLVGRLQDIVRRFKSANRIRS